MAGFQIVEQPARLLKIYRDRGQRPRLQRQPRSIIEGGRESSFRTFCFEPKISTNKVRDDAVHFIVGFEHEPSEKTNSWRFTRWGVVDLSQFKVKLKAEFQGSNHDMYRPEAIVASSGK